MIWLILGVALWWAAHLFKRIAPDARARLGDPGKGMVAVALLVSVVLMVIGYKTASGPFWWGRSPAMAGINNLLTLFAFYLFAASGMKTGITRVIRHPQLTGFAVWAFAHILPNGDLESLILFGGLLAWALVEISVLSKGPWEKNPPVPAKKEIMAIVGGVVVFIVVALLHGLLGPWPFG